MSKKNKHHPLHSNRKTPAGQQLRLFNRAELLADLDARMAEADSENDPDSWLDAWFAWLDVIGQPKAVGDE